MKVSIESKSQITKQTSRRVFKIEHTEYNFDTKETDLQLDAKGHLELFPDKVGTLEIGDDKIRRPSGEEVVMNNIEDIISVEIISEGYSFNSKGKISEEESLGILAAFLKS